MNYKQSSSKSRCRWRRSTSPAREKSIRHSHPGTLHLCSLNKPEDFILAIVEFIDAETHKEHYLRQPFERRGITTSMAQPSASRLPICWHDPRRRDEPHRPCKGIASGETADTDVALALDMGCLHVVESTLTGWRDNRDEAACYGLADVVAHTASLETGAPP